MTNAVVLTAVKQLGARWAAGRAAKWVPIAGQGAAAALSFWAVVRLGRCSHRGMSACSGAGACIADGTIIIWKYHDAIY